MPGVSVLKRKKCIFLSVKLKVIEVENLSMPLSKSLEPQSYLAELYCCFREKLQIPYFWSRVRTYTCTKIYFPNFSYMSDHQKVMQISVEKVMLSCTTF